MKKKISLVDDNEKFFVEIIVDGKKVESFPVPDSEKNLARWLFHPKPGRVPLKPLTKEEKVSILNSKFPGMEKRFPGLKRILINCKDDIFLLDYKTISKVFKRKISKSRVALERR